MRGLSYPPVLEGEVLVLFGMLIPYFDVEFVIESFNSFPDCFALRNGVKVGIEFEVDSRNFYEHKHHEDPNVDKCNLIVCWRNPLGPYITVEDKHGKEHCIEIIELERIVKEKSLISLLFPSTKQNPPSEWDEEMFLKELKKKVADESVYCWVKKLIEVCKQSTEFAIAYGKGKRYATLGFHVKKWLSQGIGTPTPIQFIDNGSIVFDCHNMEKIPAVEKGLKGRIGQVRSKRWHRWCQIPIRDENTFTILKGILEWLQQAVSTMNN